MIYDPTTGLPRPSTPTPDLSGYVKTDQTTPQVITATDVTITATDEIYYGDVTDSTKIKKDTVQGILDLVPSGITAHSALSGLDYASAGHTGFATAAQGALADTALQTRNFSYEAIVNGETISIPDNQQMIVCEEFDSQATSELQVEGSLFVEV
jgi:hypothetical protein